MEWTIYASDTSLSAHNRSTSASTTASCNETHWDIKFAMGSLGSLLSLLLLHLFRSLRHCSEERRLHFLNFSQFLSLDFRPTTYHNFQFFSPRKRSEVRGQRSMPHSFPIIITSFSRSLSYYSPCTVSMADLKSLLDSVSRPEQHTFLSILLAFLVLSCYSPFSRYGSTKSFTATIFIRISCSLLIDLSW